MAEKTIRIGTRDSELALWQAHNVEKKLNDLGYKTSIVAVKSQGDIILDKPLYELGITGIFTKTLDIAMINGDIDIAVHSMKDVPTALPKGIVQGAVLPRANVLDILVHKGNPDFTNPSTIATGSLRRQAQWFNKYPNHTVVDLRGNVNTRMQKLQDNNWDGAVFAAAGLERINLKPENYINLDWMIPAPAQGAMLVVGMENDNYTLDALSQLNDIETEICTHIERQFLRTLEGGCTAPIGALVTYNEDEDTLHFQGVLLSIDGKQKLEINKTVDISEWKKLGFNSAQEILNNGGTELMQKIKESLKK
ncbi:hydroxymethylbilane synthase [Flavobacterium johnsoniae]|uniref:Hydroxymethylbilane synthase n=1 Tax=Flavobacterium johnsoniae (strain ATCC 17061 / DSM 2064 / JCM 8514 / BCRC 14874 / CCUG 350202 / NBRC 14942 / NCIMB 11054 / UW101) TaxID=376686 RepID=A5FLE5_FLAJ1|nr:hydroxymethylbilane synthase [Flavobacterium johnsoniae]ABQ03978.1 porphobilinogen deaminase [Flavobacterium johnsoniae UW101]OXE96150.1 hydroxymethylbilane synthase [Flavobacterium johnsoniae UW101]WQG79153.1 hydroxymethylbilane synthase [Flavobacterium johnsoniae UW101]SHK08667.1 hydroxymethylbilane synthase [Flavobacterium johnsoniae]